MHTLWCSWLDWNKSQSLAEDNLEGRCLVSLDFARELHPAEVRDANATIGPVLNSLGMLSKVLKGEAGIVKTALQIRHQSDELRNATGH